VPKNYQCHQNKYWVCRKSGISFSLPMPITKWWFSNTYFNLYNNHYVGDIPKTTIAADGSSTTIFEPFNARATSYTPI
jgi:hypothetical protein